MSDVWLLLLLSIAETQKEPPSPSPVYTSRYSFIAKRFGIQRQGQVILMGGIRRLWDPVN